MSEEKKFIQPECEIITFHNEDIITISDPNFPGGVGEGHTDDTPFI